MKTFKVIDANTPKRHRSVSLPVDVLTALFARRDELTTQLGFVPTIAQTIGFVLKHQQPVAGDVLPVIAKLTPADLNADTGAFPLSSADIAKSITDQPYAKMMAERYRLAKEVKLMYREAIGGKINAIKYVREQTMVGLKDAKEFVERVVPDSRP